MHIYVATGQRYQGRVRLPGHRKYILVGKPSKSVERAAVAMARKMASGNYKRGDVISWADYYDPQIVMEMVRL